MSKITVIGTGSVGSTVAYTLTVSGIASEIVMIDINSEKAMGEALDIRQGVPFFTPCKVLAGSYYDAVGSDIVVITSGVARKPGQSRLELAQTNVNILKSVAENIVKYAPDAVYVLVSNPVDVLTYAFAKFSGIPEERIIGSGTCLDSARLATRISEYYQINQQDVQAYVLGEHGDSSFIPWSLARIAGIPVEMYPNAVLSGGNFPAFKKDEVEEYVRKSGARVIGRKGATFYAVSMSVAHLCRSILKGIDTTLAISSVMHGEYGISDVALSILHLVGRNGIKSKLLLPLTEEEEGKLRHSADCLKEVIGKLDI